MILIGDGLNEDLKDILKNGLGGVVTVLVLAAAVFVFGSVSANLPIIEAFFNEKQFSLINLVLITLVAYPIMVILIDKARNLIRFTSKEIVGGQLNQGESIPVQTKNGRKIKIQLDDISPNEGIFRITRVIISILDENGNILERFKVPQDTKKVVKINGEELKLRIGEVTAGYTFGSKWAEVGIYE